MPKTLVPGVFLDGPLNQRGDLTPMSRTNPVQTSLTLTGPSRLDMRGMSGWTDITGKNVWSSQGLQDAEKKSINFIPSASEWTALKERRGSASRQQKSLVIAC